MSPCSYCTEPDYPLDEKSGMCYMCWLAHGDEEEDDYCCSTGYHDEEEEE